jgi:hypothetical protein
MSKVIVEVEVKKITLKADVPMLEEVTQASLKVLKSQLSQGIDANGVQHKHANGKPWDFRESGDLLDTMTTSPGEIVITAEYAEHLHKIAPMDGLAPAFEEQLGRELQETAERLLLTEEEK